MKVRGPVPNQGQLATIRLAGALHDYFIIDEPCTSCGDLDDDVPIRFASPIEERVTIEPYKSGAGWVMSWADFERAYLLLKAAREERKKP